MKTYSSEFNYSQYASYDELNPVDKKLYQAACDATNFSHAPYSGLSVGAALLIDNGEIITGSNQENGSYPSGACAERVALYTVVNKPNFRKRKIDAIAIAARRDSSSNFIEISPCGECRQILVEFSRASDSVLRIIMTGPDNSIFVVDNVNQLLPFAFSNPRNSSK